MNIAMGLLIAAIILAASHAVKLAVKLRNCYLQILWALKRMEMTNER